MTIPSNEEIFALPTPDGKKIYGLLNKAEKPNGKVVIIAHGLTGHINEYLHLIARDFFTGRGYDVVRLSFYDDPEDARKLSECTIETHAQDLRQVFDRFKTQYKKPFVIGHSYGGLSMLYAAPQAAALAFWDSSFRIYDSHWQSRAQKVEPNHYRVCIGGTYHQISAEMVEVDKQATIEKLNSLAARIVNPSIVLIAEESRDDQTRNPLFEALTCPKKRVEITGADHCFTKGQTVYALLNATYDWFENNG